METFRDPLTISEAVKALIFEANFYLQVNTDVAEAGVDPWQHFLEQGFSEGRNPAPWMKLVEAFAVLKANSVGGVEPGIAELIQLVQSADATTLRWFTPFICPAWIMFQLGVEEGAFLSIMSREIPATGLSAHPALRAVLPGEELKTVQDLVKQVRHLDIAKLSLVDLEDYLRQHKDLKESLTSIEQAFAHLWSWGHQENRLKYLGGARPRGADVDSLYLLNLTLAVQSYLSGGNCYTSGRLDELSHEPVTLLKKETAGIALLDAFVVNNALTWLDRTTLFRARQKIDTSTETFGAAFAKPLALNGLRLTSISDRDLLSGRHPVRAKRVVCSINLGSYDDLPEPPVLEDAEYYLITDRLGVPEDSPWTIVRPSIREIDMKRTCLWYKTHPHKLFPDAEFVTWIDSNVMSHTGSGEILMAHEMLSEVATFSHPDRACVYKEAKEIVRLGLDHPDTIERVVAGMKAQSMPAEYGLFETNVLFMRIQDLSVQCFLDEWWSRITTGSRRDQMSFTFSAFLHNVEISNLDGPHCAKSSRFFSKREHATTKGRFV